MDNRPPIGMAMVPHQTLMYQQDPNRGPPGRAVGPAGAMVEMDFTLVHPRTQKHVSPEALYASLNPDDPRDMLLYAQTVAAASDTLQDAQDELLMRSLYTTERDNPILKNIIEQPDFSKVKGRLGHARTEKDKCDRLLLSLTSEQRKTGPHFEKWKKWRMDEKKYVGIHPPAWTSPSFMEIIIVPLIGGERKRTALEALDRLRFTPQWSLARPAETMQILSVISMVRVAGLVGGRRMDENITGSDIEVLIQGGNKVEEMLALGRSEQFATQVHVKNYVSMDGILWKDGRVHTHYERAMASGGYPSWSLNEDLRRNPLPLKAPTRLTLTAPTPATPTRQSERLTNKPGVPVPPPIVANPQVISRTPSRASSVASSYASSRVPRGFPAQRPPPRPTLQENHGPTPSMDRTPTPAPRMRSRQDGQVTPTPAPKSRPSMYDIENATGQMTLQSASKTPRRQMFSGQEHAGPSAPTPKRGHPSTSFSVKEEKTARQLEKSRDSTFDSEAKAGIEALKTALNLQLERDNERSPTPTRQLGNLFRIPLPHPTQNETFAWKLAVQYAIKQNFKEAPPEVSKTDLETIDKIGNIALLRAYDKMIPLIPGTYPYGLHWIIQKGIYGVIYRIESVAYYRQGDWDEVMKMLNAWLLSFGEEHEVPVRGDDASIGGIAVGYRDVYTLLRTLAASQKGWLNDYCILAAIGAFRERIRNDRVRVIPPYSYDWYFDGKAAANEGMPGWGPKTENSTKIIIVNYQEHWFVMVYFPPANTVAVLDSLYHRGDLDPHVACLTAYVHQQYGNSPTISHLVSRDQLNLFDCGVFAIMNARAAITAREYDNLEHQLSLVDVTIGTRVQLIREIWEHGLETIKATMHCKRTPGALATAEEKYFINDRMAARMTDHGMAPLGTPRVTRQSEASTTKENMVV
jgi:hypothetical protein